MLEIRDLNVAYGESQVLWDVSLDVPEGGVLCEGPVDRVQKDERVMEVYLGRSRDADA